MDQTELLKEILKELKEMNTKLSVNTYINIAANTDGTVNIEEIAERLSKTLKNLGKSF